MNKLVVSAQLFIISGSLALTQAQDGDGQVNFAKDVFPFLENSCVSCHKAPYVKEGRTRPTKPKAGLRFDAAFGYVSGSENGAVIVPGKPEDSPILQRVLLDEDHDDFMPPKGDVLTAEQKKILEKWIKDGADFGDWKGNEEGKPEDAKIAFEKQ